MMIHSLRALSHCMNSLPTFGMILVSLLCGSTLFAQQVALLPPSLVYNENNEVADPNWSVHRQNSTSYPIFQENIYGHEWVRIGRASTNNTGQLMHNTRLSDIQGSVIVGATFWNSTSYAIGLILRADGQEYTNAHSYQLSLNNAGLMLHYGVGNNFIAQGGNFVYQLAAAELPEEYALKLLSLDGENNNQYRIDYSFIGNQFEASLWELGAGAGGADQFITSLSYTDTRPEFREEGYFGLRARYGGSNTYALFRDIHVSVIPEPATASALLLLGLTAILLIRKRIR